MAKTVIVTNWDELPIIMDLPLAARVLGVVPETLKKYAIAGVFPAFKPDNKSWRVTKDALKKYIKEKEQSNERRNVTVG